MHDSLVTAYLIYPETGQGQPALVTAVLTRHPGGVDAVDTWSIAVENVLLSHIFITVHDTNHDTYHDTHLHLHLHAMITYHDTV